MELYESYVKDATENYKKLPQETNELYKRHHINIDHEFSFELDSVNEELNHAVKEYKSKLDMEFDVVLGSHTHLIKENQYVKLESPDKSEEKIRGMMHKSMEDKYIALINAHSKRFLCIEVPDGKSAELKILFLNSDAPLVSHVFLNVGNNAKIKLVEIYASSSTRRSMMGVIHEIRSGSGSNVELDALHNENSNTDSISFSRNKMADNSKLRFNSFYNGAENTRSRNVIEADGSSSNVSVNEIVFGSSTQKFDINTIIMNSGRESNASLESKAVLTDSSFCILKGFAKVMKGASKSRSFVHERGILLDKRARVDALPDMSVAESDVKATHSSATSPVDPETVFYLMSKSIDELGVKRLIVSGFLAESISKMHNDAARRLSISLVNDKLERKAFGHIPKIDKEKLWEFGEEREKDLFIGHYKYR